MAGHSDDLATAALVHEAYLKLMGLDGASDLLGVDEALDRLAEREPRMARVVELRFFGGLTVAEVARVLETSPRTVEREWTRAKACLLESIRRDERV